MVNKDWYEAFNQYMNPVFTKEDFENYKKGVLKDLKYYKKYLSAGAKILDLGCGLGCEAVPLSSLGYKIAGIDNDKRVVEAARQNGKNFGGDIEIIEGDIFKLDKIFDKNLFDACISGGVLEHFKKEDVRKLVNLQLKLAPLVIASMPVKTTKSMKAYSFSKSNAINNIDKNGIYRNFWSEDEWTNKILKNYNIIEHFVVSCDPAIGNFDLVYLFIKRKRAPSKK